MPVSRNRPGPMCRFPQTMELALRDDQERSVARIAQVLGVSRPEVVRWFVDSGVQAIEGASTFSELEEVADART